MTPRPLRRFTPEEDDLLRMMARSGESAAEISKRLNRDRKAVRERASRLKIVIAKARKLKL
jgi:DNA-binding NarL/FixJ family response regulator